LITSPEKSSLALGLQESVVSAIENHFGLRVQTSKVETAKLKVDEKWGDFFPSIELETEHAGVNQHEPSEVDRNTSSFTFNITQPIYNPAVMQVYDEQKLNSEVGEYEYESQRSLVVLQVLQSYLKLCSFQQQIEVVQKNLDQAEEGLRIRERLEKKKYSTKIDSITAEMDVGSYQSESEELRGQHQQEKQQFLQLTGSAIEELTTLCPEYKKDKKIATTQSFEVWKKLAEKHNPTYK
ncbi:MAG: TolC family protein, partial [Proteobacteria bacterium]|nr:TolC family protein [Pseudomonadota bacterium]